MPSSESGGRASDLLLHPVVVGALAIWVLNDHVFKPAVASWWTGKLSDAAGLVVFPVFVATAFERFRLGHHRDVRRTIGLSIVLTVLAFTAVKLTLQGAWLYQAGLGLAQWPWHALVSVVSDRPPPNLRHVALAMDATDLWTLPLAGVAACLPVHRLSSVGTN